MKSFCIDLDQGRLAAAFRRRRALGGRVEACAGRLSNTPRIFV
jgi:hypothetical protein